MENIRTQLKRGPIWLQCLVVCVLFRAMIPVGFMPSAGDTSGWFTLCHGNAGSAQWQELSHQQQHQQAANDPSFDHGGHHSHHHQPHSLLHDHSDQAEVTEEHAHQQSSDHDFCLFASVSLKAIGSNSGPAVEQVIGSLIPTNAPQDPSSSPPFHLQFARAPPVSYFHATT